MSLVTSESFDLMAQCFFGLSHGDFVDAFDVLLRLASAAWLLTVTLGAFLSTFGTSIGGNNTESPPPLG